MPSITIPWLGRGGRNQGGNSNSNNQQRPPALSYEEQLNAWRGSGIPEPPMPPPNPMPVPQVPDLNYGGGQTNWMPQQSGGGGKYGFGGGGGGGQGMDMRSMGGLFEALMRLFQ
jgi:hypothetical protein